MFFSLLKMSPNQELKSYYFFYFFTAYSISKILEQDLPWKMFKLYPLDRYYIDTSE